MFKDFLREEYGGILKKFFKTIAIHFSPYFITFLISTIILPDTSLIEKIGFSIIVGFITGICFGIPIILIKEKYERWQLLKRIEERIHK